MLDILRFLTSAPTTDRQAADAAYRETSFMYRTMEKASDSPCVEMPPDLHRGCGGFWADQYTAIPEKTRGNILISITTVLDRFTHGRFAKAFCGRTTVLPEMTFHGAVIVLAMPTLSWNEDGIIAHGRCFSGLTRRRKPSRITTANVSRCVAARKPARSI